MSKDKGSKNIKKAPADRTTGKAKPSSDYQKESKSKSSADSVIPKDKGGKKA
jgi:hypothetical protein